MFSVSGGLGFSFGGLNHLLVDAVMAPFLFRIFPRMIPITCGFSRYDSILRGLGFSGCSVILSMVSKLNHLRLDSFNVAQFQDTPSFPLESGNLSGTNAKGFLGFSRNPKSMSSPS